jgi:glycosyltransferase involved in cell wall biosynthesis
MLGEHANVPNAERKPRLLFVVNQAAFFLSHRLPLALAAREAGYDVHVAVPVASPADVVRAAGLPVHHIPIDRGGANPIQELKLLLSLRDLYRRLAPDVVHHVTIKPVLYGSFVAQWTKVPAVVNAVPGLGYAFLAKGRAAGLRRRVIVGMYGRAFAHPNSRVIFQNPDDIQRLLTERTVRADQISLIRGSGVDLAQFAYSPEPETNRPLVVLGARLLRIKGVREFVTAAELLRARAVPVRMALVGETDANPSSISPSELASWAADGAVEWWGRRADMHEVLAQANIACLPSYGGEGVPKFLIEGAATGRAIVTTDVPGCREVVADGVNGLLVPPRDPQLLADAIERLVRSPELRAQMGRAGRERAEKEFDVRQVVRDTLTIYRELLASH